MKIKTFYISVRNFNTIKSFFNFMDKLEIVLAISYLEQLFWDFGIVEKKIYFFERKAINLPKLYKTLVPHF